MEGHGTITLTFVVPDNGATMQTEAKEAKLFSVKVLSSAKASKIMALICNETNRIEPVLGQPTQLYFRKPRKRKSKK